MSSSQLDDINEENRDRYIAKELGITYEELCDTQFEIANDEGPDGMIYGYIIKFDEDSSEEVLEKISGLENNQVAVSLSTFDLDDESHSNRESVLAYLTEKVTLNQPTSVSFNEFAKATGLSKDDLDIALIQLQNIRKLKQDVLENHDNFLITLI
jgi:hypothetical protein